MLVCCRDIISCYGDSAGTFVFRCGTCVLGAAGADISTLASYAILLCIGQGMAVVCWNKSFSIRDQLHHLLQVFVWGGPLQTVRQCRIHFVAQDNRLLFPLRPNVPTLKGPRPDVHPLEILQWPQERLFAP